MKAYPRILTLLLCALLLLLPLLACTPAEPPASDGPAVPDEPPAGDGPDEPDEPSEPLVPSKPNTFSPISEKAGKPFLKETSVTNVQAENGITRFMLMTEHNPELPFNVACNVTRNAITAMLPAGLDLSAVTVSFAATSDVMLGDRKLLDGDTLDLREPLTLTVTDSAGKVEKVTLDIQTLRTGLPSVALTVDEFAEINSKETYFSSTFYLGGGDEAICDYATDLTLLVDAEAKGRGNSSWGYPKRSFTVKLAEKKNLLGLGRSRNWTLVSNYQDKSLMRNEIAAQLSEMLGMPTMNTRAVDLWLNGRYWGTYLLIEKVELEEGRIDLPDYDEVTDPSEAGLLLEWDGHVNEVGSDQKAQWQNIGSIVYDPVADIHFLPLDGSFVVIHKPSAENILPEQLERAERIIREVDSAIRSKNYALLEQKIDIESFAAWYLVEDIMKNMDARFHSSCYMYVGGDGVLHMGPVWDFDMSLGNANYGGVNDPNGTHISTSKWYKYLLQIEEFCEVVQSMLLIHEDELEDLVYYMDDYADMLDRSQTYNFERWDILNVSVGWNPTNVVEANTYDKQITLLKEFYKARLQVVSDIVNGLYDDSTPAPSIKLPSEPPKAPEQGVALWSGVKQIEDVRSLKFMIDFRPAHDLAAYAEDGVVCLTYWISSLDTLTSGHQLELTSSGGSDNGEFSWALDPAKQMKAGSWQTLYLPISEADLLNRGVAPDWSHIDFFRIYVHVGQIEQFYISDLRVMHLYEID